MEGKEKQCHLTNIQSTEKLLLVLLITLCYTLCYTHLHFI